jgi:hypothetical protein
MKSKKAHPNKNISSSTKANTRKNYSKKRKFYNFIRRRNVSWLMAPELVLSYFYDIFFRFFSLHCHYFLKFSLSLLFLSQKTHHEAWYSLFLYFLWPKYYMSLKSSQIFLCLANMMKEVYESKKEKIIINFLFLRLVKISNFRNCFRQHTRKWNREWEIKLNFRFFTLEIG